MLDQVNIRISIKNGIQKDKMIKIISVVGARPNFMKVAPIYRETQKFTDKVDHKILHTGQHYDKNMSDAFFNDLGLPKPDFHLGVGSASHAVQTAKIMVEFEKVCLEEKPNLVIVVGDVNSTIACSLVAVKLGIKVAHVESGLRSYDRAMPEEINRLATDKICDYLFVTEKSGKENLLAEGFKEEQIFFVGNTMIDSLVHALEKTKESQYFNKYEKKSYALVTMHRPSNVDTSKKLQEMLETIREVSENIKVVIPLHPRTRAKAESFNLLNLLESDNIELLEPLGFNDFMALMQNSKFVLTDSGGIQEETTKLDVPCLTMRTTTERPSTIDEGTNILIKPEKKVILDSVNEILTGKFKKGKVPEFWDGKAAERIVEIIFNLNLN